MFGQQMVDAQRETRETILERGHKALMAELGPTGAVEFLRLSGDAHRPEATRDSVKDVLIEISVEPETQEVAIRFSRPTSWLRFSASDAMAFAKAVACRAASLLQKQS